MDFSTNQHSAKFSGRESPARHKELCFSDGNLAVLTGNYYFLIHEGVICRASPVLTTLTKALDRSHAQLLEGRPVLALQSSADAMASFLQALYDGISYLNYDVTDFAVVSKLLRLFSKYEVHRLRTDLLRGLSSPWPLTLAQWDFREARAMDSHRSYAPREKFPHPILVINLARETDSNELLPSAFYDLSRCAPSQATMGYRDPNTAETHRLSDSDLLNLLRGREHALRFFSVFIVNELEGRLPSEWCIYRNETDIMVQRKCHIAFEAITFELIQDTTADGGYCKRSADPLYAIAEAELMQTRDDVPAGENKSIYRACEACRGEFGEVVDAARQEFWDKIPGWFGVDVSNWG